MAEPSARVWIVPLSKDPIAGPDGPTELTWLDVVETHDRYFYPAESSSYPSPPDVPDYIAFRYDGHLQRISHVDRWEVVGEISDRYDELPPGTLADRSPLVHLELGPAIRPTQPVPSGGVFGPGHQRADLDLLLTGEDVKQAVDATTERDATPRER